MKKWNIIIVILAAPIFFICAFVVWPPDIFTNAHHTIASVTLTNGDSFSVVQYWNHADFYTTELDHRFPDGRVTAGLLDADDSKSWTVPISVDEQKRTVNVTLSGHRLKTVIY